jgi:hypothetical protein
MKKHKEQGDPENLTTIPEPALADDWVDVRVSDVLREFLGPGDYIEADIFGDGELEERLDYELQFVSAVLAFLCMDKEQLGFDLTIVLMKAGRYIELNRLVKGCVLLLTRL